MAEPGRDLKGTKTIFPISLKGKSCGIALQLSLDRRHTTKGISEL